MTARRTSRACAVALLGLAGAAAPTVLSTIQPGLWEISRAGASPQRLCLASVATLGRFESRRSTCTQTVIGDNGLSAKVSYSCGGGEFGESAISLITPRSIRVQTQGIADGAPFKYTFQARRIGDCPAH